MINLIPKDEESRAAVRASLDVMRQHLAFIANKVEARSKQDGKTVEQAFFVMGAFLIFTDYMDKFVEKHLPVYPELLRDTLINWLKETHEPDTDATAEAREALSVLKEGLPKRTGEGA